MRTNGDLNNTSAAREVARIDIDAAHSYRSLAISEAEDDATIRKSYRPFLLSPEITSTDWISKLELSTVVKLAEEDLHKTGERLKVLVLYGSLRERSYSRLLAFEASRILFRLGCDVRVFDPTGLPMKDDVQHNQPKVQELRDLGRLERRPCLGLCRATWESHCRLQKPNRLDPPLRRLRRPTQGRTLAIAQVSGGSQSFNAVNSLRLLGRWMRMFVIPNQSSVPMAYTQFTDERLADPVEGGSRMIPSGNRMRIVDCMEEFVKYTILMRPHFALFGDRCSEREERVEKERKATEKARKEAEEKRVE
ncbi:hypothetical protein VE04_05388 [Pseudogymnoascus sp. 24MN13]|nr:hypothetical protein VE04_05388 [Pseudogymnoascus sp. 24MN13]